MIELFLNNQWYLFYLLVIMFVSGFVKDKGYLNQAFNWINKHLKNKKAIVAILSLFGGILPIPGRVAVSAGLLDTIASRKKESRSKFGIIGYLATHHYYLWSPLEKTIILPIAILGLSYFEVLRYTFPLLLVSICYIAYYIIFKIDGSDIQFDSSRKSLSPVVRLDWLSYINIKLLVTVAVIIALSNFIGTYKQVLYDYVLGFPNVYVAAVVGFLASVALGSSGKFIGITVLLTQLYGLEYFTMLFAVEYAGYLVSPTHKCTAVGKVYFGTPIKDYAIVLGSWAVLILLVGIIV